MADVKWIKLTTNMFDNRKIKHLRRLPDGNNIVLIWVMLLTMAGRCNAGGMIFLTENIPYDSKMLADELDFEENTVKLALEALERFEMIVRDQGFFSIAGWEEYQNIEGMEKIREQNRLRQKKWYDSQKALPNVRPNVSITQPNAIEEEIEEDKDRDRENKKKRETTRTLFERIVHDYILDMEEHAELLAKTREWIEYKAERREAYKEQGLKALLRKIENNALTYGDQAVCDLIDECMANGWKGIIFDKLEKTAPKGKPLPTAQSRRPNFDLEAAENMAYKRAHPPLTAGEDEGIRARADALKEELTKRS